MILLLIILKLNIVNFISSGWSYPEMVRHGYGNCIACHVSTTGGGLLTQYGRALSKELLTVKNTDPTKEKVKNEELFLKGWFIPPANIDLGGDIRFLQMFMDNKRETSGRAIFMQADLEGQITLNPRLRILATAGRQETKSTPNKITDTFISRRHWVNLLVGPDENKEKYQVRLGRFFPAFGLNIAEHTAVTRRGLGFDQNQESYNAELSYLGENWNLITSLIAGRPDKKELDREEGGAIQTSWTVKSNSKIGANIYTGNGVNHPSKDRRTMVGLFAIHSINPKLYTLLEFDRTYTPAKSYGVFEYGKLGYEYIQGLHFYLSLEYSKPTIVKFDKKIEVTSLGIQYFPWVHWEINTVLSRVKNTFISDDPSNIAMILLHCYL